MDIFSHFQYILKKKKKGLLVSTVHVELRHQRRASLLCKIKRMNMNICLASYRLIFGCQRGGSEWPSCLHTSSWKKNVRMLKDVPSVVYRSGRHLSSWHFGGSLVSVSKRDNCVTLNQRRHTHRRISSETCELKSDLWGLSCRKIRLSDDGFTDSFSSIFSSKSSTHVFRFQV